ncbi:ABC transporter substrate-binding protein, partial [Acinetobacter baumannii]
MTGAAQAASPAAVPVLSFSSDATVAAPGVFVLGFLPQQDADRIVSYAVSKGKKRIAALLPDDGYGQVVGAAFRQAVTRE